MVASSRVELGGRLLATAITQATTSRPPLAGSRCRPRRGSRAGWTRRAPEPGRSTWSDRPGRSVSLPARTGAWARHREPAGERAGRRAGLADSARHRVDGPAVETAIAGGGAVAVG